MISKKETIKEARKKYQSVIQDQTVAGKTARFFSIYFTLYFFANSRITPNQITFFGVLVYLIGAILFSFNVYYLSMIGFLLFYVETILDACDGELFRCRRYRDGYGSSYVEPLSHDIKYGFMFMPISYGAFLLTGNSWILVFGMFASVFKMLFRMTEFRFFWGVSRMLHKKGNTDDTKNFKEHSFLSRFIFKIYRNFFTSTGMLTPLFLATLFEHLDYFIIFYGTGYFFLWLGLISRQVIRFTKISKQVIDRHEYFVGIKKNIKQKKVICLDLDGTIIDTMGIFSEIASYLMVWKYGVDRDFARTKYIETSGLPFFKQLEIIFPGDKRNQEVADFFEERKVHATEHLQITPEEKEVLLKLIENGYKLAVSSNNFQENVDLFVKLSSVPFTYALGYKESFAKGKEHFDFIKKQENISEDRILFVADSVYDLKKAKENNVDFIGKIGTVTKQDFENEFSNAITVRDLNELRNILVN